MSLSRPFRPFSSTRKSSPAISPPSWRIRCTVAAARKSSSKDSGGSQFFVVLKEQPPLLGQYTIFGEVVSGMEVVDQLSLTPVVGDKPTERVEMKVTISTPVAP